MENNIELTRTEIIADVKRTGIVCRHHLSATTADLICSYYDYDNQLLAGNNLLDEVHMIAYFKVLLEASEKYPKEDLEVLNLVYQSPVETLPVTDGYVEIFADGSMLHHRREKVLGIHPCVRPCFPDEYVSRNIQVVTAAHDRKYLVPDSLTEADANEINITSRSHFRFQYESDLRTVYAVDEEFEELNFLRTLALKRPKPVYQNLARAAFEKIDIKDFSEFGAKLITDTADQHFYTDPNKFLQIQSALHFFERKFLGYLKKPKFAENADQLQRDLLIIQAFKEASVDIDQIILPRAEILVFSDRSLLHLEHDEEPEIHLDVYQFIMNQLRIFQRVYFFNELEEWGPTPDSLSSQFGKYGISFSYANGRVITKFTRKFKMRLFNAANVRLA